MYHRRIFSDLRFCFSVYKRFRDIRPNDRNFSKNDKLNPEEIYSLPEFSVRLLSYICLVGPKTVEYCLF